MVTLKCCKPNDVLIIICINIESKASKWIRKMAIFVVLMSCCFLSSSQILLFIWHGMVNWKAATNTPKTSSTENVAHIKRIFLRKSLILLTLTKWRYCFFLSFVGYNDNTLTMHTNTSTLFMVRLIAFWFATTSPYYSNITFDEFVVVVAHVCDCILLFFFSFN